MVVNNTVDGKNNLEEITREVADNRAGTVSEL